MTDDDLRVHLYRWFVETGAAPSPEETASTFGVPLEEAEAAYRRLEGAHVIVLAPGTTNVAVTRSTSGASSAPSIAAPFSRWTSNGVWPTRGTRIEPSWRRRTPEEAEVLFSTLGLEGAFWRLT